MLVKWKMKRYCSLYKNKKTNDLQCYRFFYFSDYLMTSFARSTFYGDHWDYIKFFLKHFPSGISRSMLIWAYPSACWSKCKKVLGSHSLNPLLITNFSFNQMLRDLPCSLKMCIYNMPGISNICLWHTNMYSSCWWFLRKWKIHSSVLSIWNSILNAKFT